jgi:hypothetical protein
MTDRKQRLIVFFTVSGHFIQALEGPHVPAPDATIMTAGYDVISIGVY